MPWVLACGTAGVTGSPATDAVRCSTVCKRVYEERHQWELLPDPCHQFGLLGRKVSWERGWSHALQQSPVASPHTACPPTACPSVAASRGLPTFPFVMCRDGGPELVIRGEHPVIAMPVLPRSGHEISEPVDKLKWRKLDDTADARPRGLPSAPRANPVGRLVSREHVAVDNRDQNACVHRKTTGLSSDHVGGRISVEEPLYAEPPHDMTAHLLGERGQIRLGDRSSRQEHRPPVTGWHEDAVGRAHMQVHVVAIAGAPDSSLPMPDSSLPMPDSSHFSE